MAPIPRDSYCFRVQKEPVYGEFWRDVGTELVATFLFVSGQIGLTILWGELASVQLMAIQAGLGAAFLWSALRHGFLCYGGAHINPAVTLAAVVRAEITVVKGLLYWGFQAVGGILGAFFIHSITPAENIGFLGITDLGVNIDQWQGVLIEMWTTFILCLVTLRAGQDTVIPTGLAVGFGTFVAFRSTGGSMNPARSLGAAVAYTALEDEDVSWKNHWVYWVGPLAGGLLAGALVWLLERARPTDMTPPESLEHRVENVETEPRRARVKDSLYAADRPRHAWHSNGDNTRKYYS